MKFIERIKKRKKELIELNRIRKKFPDYTIEKLDKNFTICGRYKADNYKEMIYADTIKKLEEKLQ